MSTVLIATDLVVRYRDQTVPNGATLAFEDGDRVGLVGRNGRGKTTFLKIILIRIWGVAVFLIRREELIIQVREPFKRWIYFP